MDNPENKVKGFRKAGIAIATITALVYKPPTEIYVVIIIGIVAITGILVQGFIDWKGCKE